MKFWKDMAEDERMNASPRQWNTEGFGDDNCMFEKTEPDRNGCEWEYVVDLENGGNE